MLLLLHLVALYAIVATHETAEVDASGLIAFRRQYPRGESFIVAHDAKQSYIHRYGGISARIVGLPELIETLLKLQRKVI